MNTFILGEELEFLDLDRDRFLLTVFLLGPYVFLEEATVFGCSPTDFFFQKAWGILVA